MLKYFCRTHTCRPAYLVVLVLLCLLDQADDVKVPHVEHSHTCRPAYLVVLVLLCLLDQADDVKVPL